MIRRRGSLFSGIIGSGGAVSLWWRGHDPVSLAVDMHRWTTSQTLLSSRDGLILIVLVLAWACCAALLTLAAYSILMSVTRVISHTVARVAEVRRTTALGTLITFASGLLAVAKPNHDVGGAIANAEVVIGESPGDSPDSGGRALSATLKPHEHSVLPALASGGLAIALTGRIQRERERLLQDAPLSSRLRPPDSAAMVTGIAMFESANRERDRPEFDVHAMDEPKTPIDAPLVIPLGIADSRVISMQLQPGDTVSIDGEQHETRAVLRHVINTLACAPWIADPVVIVTGFDSNDLIVPGTVVLAATAREAVVRALEARKRGEHSVVVVTARHCTELNQLTQAGIIVISSLVQGAHNVSRVTRHPGTWSVSTTNESFQPYGVRTTEAANLRQAVQQMTTLEVNHSASIALDVPWDALIRVLGPVEVLHGSGSEITFRKSKAIELLCWLAFHRNRPTVAAARTALWEIDVKDATFHNVLSEVRRGLSSEGIANGVGRVGKQRLFIKEEIVSDADVLRATLSSIDDLHPEVAVHRLSDALSLVRALPFCAAEYAWADAEGITSTLVWQVTKAVQRTAELAQSLGDDAPIVRAAAAGLRMSPGDEAFLHLQQHVRFRLVST